MILFWHTALFLVGFLLMSTAWWWDGHDLTLGDTITFLIGSALMGPLYVCLYWYLRYLSIRPPREPIVLIRGRR